MDKNIITKFVDKSIEAFILGIEIYNKPTINYRVEAFSFLICNAWELMLKAHMMKTFGPDSIYYKKTPDKSLSLKDCIKKVFTNNKDPLRINLEKIIDLRNTSTHFITEEYEIFYLPLFQACVLNFSDKIMEFHNVEITDYIPRYFLTLNASMEAIEHSSIIAKYPEEIANKIIENSEELDGLSNELNERFAIKIVHKHYLVKDKSKATSFVKIDKNAEKGVQIINKLQDPRNTHPYSFSRVIKIINEKLKSKKIDFNFTSHIFQLFIKKHDLKSDERYCWKFRQSEKTVYYRYSQHTIDLIMDEIKKDPENIVQNLKKQNNNKR